MFFLLKSTRQGFNGATPRRGWRLGLGLVCSSGIDVSMGPPPEGDGDDLATILSSLELWFQWGHPPKGMETGRSGSAEGQGKAFQWGHPPKGMETDTFVTRVGRGRDVSMGPPPEGDGDEALQVVIEDLFSFQWGHPPKGMETQNDAAQSAWRISRFNGATPRRGWRLPPSEGMGMIAEFHPKSTQHLRGPFGRVSSSPSSIIKQRSCPHS